MKEWWQQLALREKKIVAGGVVIVGFLLIYLIIWSPLTNAVDTLRRSIVKNQHLLAWMQQADTQIHTLAATATTVTVPSSPSPAALLGWLQHSIQQAGLTRQLTQIKEGSDESVLLQFQAVDFDVLIDWLAQAQEQQGFKVSQMAVAKTPAPGMVNAEITLHSA